MMRLMTYLSPRLYKGSDDTMRTADSLIGTGTGGLDAR